MQKESSIVRNDGLFAAVILPVIVFALWTIGAAVEWSDVADLNIVRGLFVLAALGIGFFRLGRGRLPLPSSLWQVIAVLVTFGLILSLDFRGDGAARGFVLISYVIYGLLLLALSMMFQAKARAPLVNLAVSAVAVLFTFGLAELLAPMATDIIAEAQRQAAVEAARDAANLPADPDSLEGETQTPVTTGASPQAEFIERGPGPAWGELTGWGTNTNTILHYWLDGVYDVTINYNSEGFRGPEVAYEKPDDVYRIMLVGDSFIEAREVTYEDTIYAQLGKMLADAHTPDGKRFEVFGVGSVGWGTLQAYLYYHHEGVKFAPDLIVHVFVINDVVDNYPAQFYADRDIDFAIGEDSVQILQDGVAVVETQERPITRWLNALPGFLSDSNMADLLRRVFDPPRDSVTLSGNLTNLHPQGYIFVREPEIEGYPEAWRRTQRAYEIWANEAQQNGSELMVMAVDISVERITEVSTYYIEEQDGWVWDVDLPYKQLTAYLDPIDVPLILTRDRYEEYAQSVGLRPFDALFYVEDGHWNPTGHRVSAELLADTLREQGIVAGE